MGASVDDDLAIWTAAATGFLPISAFMFVHAMLECLLRARSSNREGGQKTALSCLLRSVGFSLIERVTVRKTPPWFAERKRNLTV